MRIHCFECSKSVSSEVPDETILRAVAVCPECLQKGYCPRCVGDGRELRRWLGEGLVILRRWTLRRLTPTPDPKP